MVFLGTVTEVLNNGRHEFKRARMRVDHSYKGVSEKELVVFDNGICDGPDLRIGEQYLMYTRREADGEVPSRGCTRSRHVKDAAEDLKYLDELADGKATTMLRGIVVGRMDDSGIKVEPAAGAQVDVSSPAGQYTTFADGEGRYSISGIEPADYVVTAGHTGFRMLSFGPNGEPKPTKVEPGGCAVADVVLRRTWRANIEGRVIRASGIPGPAGMDLTLERIEENDRGVPGSLSSSSTSTDANGDYSFREVGPGQYKIVLNLYHFPTARAPYPTIYSGLPRTPNRTARSFMSAKLL